MSDVGRLPGTAAKLEASAEHLETVVRYSRSAGWITRWTREAAQDRATAALLRAIEDTLDPLIPENWNVIGRASALVAAVLGLPEDNERTAGE